MKHLLLTTIAAVLVVGTALADPIHDAAGNGDLAGVQAELDKGVEVDAKMQGGYTPLHFAARGHKEIAELLIAKGADVNAKNNNEWTPLHFAAANDHKEIIELLIANGADVNAKDYLGWTPLLRAAKGGNRRLAELLIDKGADVNANSNRDATPLHHAAKEGHKEIAELLIAKGADVNAKGSDGASPLHWSALFGQKEVVELLIAKDADVNAKDEYGMTPLGFSTLPDTPFDTAETADLLRKHGGKHGTINSAAGGGDIEAVKDFLAAGADVNARDEVYGGTPLDRAAGAGRKEIVELLIAEGADVNAKGEEGTPLHLAANFGHKEIIKLLIAKGADVNAKDNWERTPLDWADGETSDLLRKHGGKTGAELALMPPRLVPHGRFAFSFDAKEGKVYEVQDSFDLLNWEVIKTYTGTGDLVRFDEERDHDPPKWFYRVKVVE